MAPEEFFETASVGCYVRYVHRHVRIDFVCRGTPYAIGREVGTGRKVYLLLCNDMLKECGYGCFNDVEIVA